MISLELIPPKGVEMHKTCMILAIALLSLGCVMLSSCSSLRCLKTEGEGFSDTTDFASEIARLQQMAEGGGDASVRAQAHLQLARIYSDYRNPHMDYDIALQHLRTYVKENAEGGENGDVQNWLSVLQELETERKEVKKSAARIDTLVKESASLKEALDQSEKKNKEMKEIIEKLQSIDIQIEEKRKNIK